MNDLVIQTIFTNASDEVVEYLKDFIKENYSNTVTLKENDRYDCWLESHIKTNQTKTKSFANANPVSVLIGIHNNIKKFVYMNFDIQPLNIPTYVIIEND